MRTIMDMWFPLTLVGMLALVGILVAELMQ
jgi:hypothetical protein